MPLIKSLGVLEGMGVCGIGPRGGLSMSAKVFRILDREL